METDWERTAGTSDRAGQRASIALCVLVLLAVVSTALPAGGAAEQGSAPTSLAAGQLDAGGDHSCAVLGGGAVRCWGFSGDGQVGYGNRNAVGDDESPGSTGPVDLGSGRTATAISAGDFHTCALLDGGDVRCWGFGGRGQLGYGKTASVGDDESPGSVGPVDLGSEGPATAISAGQNHTCALLDGGKVRCWGLGGEGRLGYGSSTTIGDDEAPSKVDPVDLGSGRTATAISAGGLHTCALLDGGDVRCWGFGASGQLGYGNTASIGDTESPGFFGPVDLGPERTATAISAGKLHTCALLDNGKVRCWGYGADGRLGYGNTTNVGDSEAPSSVAPVDLGPGRTVAISAGDAHTCALLDNGSVRCWGLGADGRLGYGNTASIGDNEFPSSVAPVDLGPGRTAVAISAGGRHTCARLDDGTVRCWGSGASGQLGYCNINAVGDDEFPGSVGPVGLEAPGSGCAAPGAGGSVGGGSVDGGPATTPGVGGPQSGGSGSVSSTRPSPSGPSRGPGRVKGLKARAASKSKIRLTFRAVGNDGSRPPAAQAYLVKQSRRPIRRSRDFARAQTLCTGNCRFPVVAVGTKIILTITDLSPRTTYYYAVAARENGSKRLGPRSKTVKARTR